VYLRCKTHAPLCCLNYMYTDSVSAALRLGVSCEIVKILSGIMYCYRNLQQHERYRQWMNTRTSVMVFGGTASQVQLEPRSYCTTGILTRC
jgi:hypothetical protein